MSKIKIEFTNERIIPASGLSIVGAIVSAIITLLDSSKSLLLTVNEFPFRLSTFFDTSYTIPV